MIRIAAVGRLKEPGYRQLCAEYGKRLSAYTRIEISEVKDEPAPQNNSPAQDEQVKRAEGERLLKQLKEKDTVVLLDRQGQELSSEQLAAKLDQLLGSHGGDLVFLIGGSLGVSPEVRQRADFILKLSELTFPHNLARVILLEQLYRSFRILNHEPYHK